MTDVPGTSPERPIIWFPGRPATGSRKRPQKTFFLLNYQFFCWSPKSPLNVPWRSQKLRHLGDLQGTSPGRRVPAGLLFLLCVKVPMPVHRLIGPFTRADVLKLTPKMYPVKRKTWWAGIDTFSST